MLYNAYIFFIGILATLGLKISAEEYKTVQTRSGSIKGLLVDQPAFLSAVYQYRAIPYAMPPVGQLRFQKPQMISQWNGTLNATEFGPSCPQTFLEKYAMFKPNISEDCLFLNVYVPQNTSVNDSKSVMIFIHGGGYTIGAGTSYDGSNLALVGDVIVVTINYRLGLLGFLTTMDSASRGNFGLWDQQMAIRWVKENIEGFGGNPLSVTIFGESAGGFSVALQALHSGNKDLFQNVIAESGVANGKFATAHETRTAAFTFGKLVGCATNESSELVNCLRQKSFDKILEASDKTIDQASTGTHFEAMANLAPNVDSDFIEDQPITLLRNPDSKSNVFFQSLNLIVGCVNTEGSLLLDFIETFRKESNFNVSEGIPYQFLCNDFASGLTSDYFSNNSNVLQAICDFYKVSEDNATYAPAQSRSAVNLFGDFFFYEPALVYLDSHRSSGNTYQYMFSKAVTYGFLLPHPAWFKGAGHGSEIAFLFATHRFLNISKEIDNLSMEMSKYWTNFAKTGNPNGNNIKVMWPQYTPSGQEYLDFDVPISQKDHIFKDRMEFWRHLISPDVANPMPAINRSNEISLSFAVNLSAIILVLFIKGLIQSV